MTSSRKPERTCIVCRAKRTADDLLRIARDRTGRLNLIHNGPSYSRSAYFCPSLVCAQRVTEKGAIPRALRAQVSTEEIEFLKQSISCKTQLRQNL